MPPKQIPRFTVEQGRYLAFIYYYTRIHGTPPAESDFRDLLARRTEREEVTFRRPDHRQPPGQPAIHNATMSR